MQPRSRSIIISRRISRRSWRRNEDSVHTGAEATELVRATTLLLDGRADRVAQAIAMHRVHALADCIGQPLAQRIRDATTDRVCELFGIEAAEELLLDQRRADGRAETLAENILDVILDRVSDLLPQGLRKATAHR